MFLHSLESPSKSGRFSQRDVVKGGPGIDRGTWDSGKDRVSGVEKRIK
jgi:hypothetical protein